MTLTNLLKKVGVGVALVGSMYSCGTDVGSNVGSNGSSNVGSEKDTYVAPKEDVSSASEKEDISRNNTYTLSDLCDKFKECCDKADNKGDTNICKPEFKENCVEYLKKNKSSSEQVCLSKFSYCDVKNDEVIVYLEDNCKTDKLRSDIYDCCRLDEKSPEELADYCDSLTKGDIIGKINLDTGLKFTEKDVRCLNKTLTCLSDEGCKEHGVGEDEVSYGGVLLSADCGKKFKIANGFCHLD